MKNFLKKNFLEDPNKQVANFKKRFIILGFWRTERRFLVCWTCKLLWVFRWIPIIAWIHKNNLLNKNGSFVNYINNSLNENSLSVLPLITAPGAYKILKLWGAALIWGPALIRGNTVYITCWMKTILSLKKYMICLKELRNCVFGIICMWSLFCSVRVYISQPFLTIVLVKLSYFCVSVTLVFCF